MTKSTQIYKRLLEGKTDLQKAELLMADLVGYRKFNLHRTDDTDTVVNFIQAVRGEIK
jgi:hypothetical protein